MPTLKEYRFEDSMNSNVVIIISAYDYESACELLEVAAKHPEDFIYRNN